MTSHKFQTFAENNLNIASRNGSEYMVRCIFHENEGSAAMQFNIDKGMFVCFSCGAGGGIKKLSRKLGIRYTEKPDAALNDLIGSLNRLRDQSNKSLSLTVLPESHLERYDFPTDYWTKRGFTEDTIKAFHLGFDPIQNAAIIPVRNTGGGLVGVIRRFLDPDEEFRYRYPLGFKRSHNLFGSWLAEHDPGDAAVLVEGSVDAMAVWQAGFIGIACYGSSISREQIRVLHRMGIQEVICMFDNDKAGRKAVRLTQGWKTHLHGDEKVHEYDRTLDLTKQFRYSVVKWKRNQTDPGALASDPDAIRRLVARSNQFL